MKQMKKVWALVLALAMALALGVTVAVAADPAQVRINGTELTESKAYTNAEIPQITAGTVTWDAAAGTLTLDNATITVPGAATAIHGIEFPTTEPVTIKLQGTNALTVGGDNDSQYSIKSEGALTIQGSSQSDSLTISGPGYGVVVSQALTVDKVSLTVERSANAALQGRGIAIRGSKLNVTEQSAIPNACAIYSPYAGAVIENSEIIAVTDGTMAIREAGANASDPAAVGVTIRNSTLKLTVNAANAGGGVGISAQSGLCYNGGTINVTMVNGRMNVSDCFPTITGYSNPRYRMSTDGSGLALLPGAPTAATGFGNGAAGAVYQDMISIEEIVYRPSHTGSDVVPAPKTFDAGIGVYAVSALLSVTGGAWLMSKKRK